MLSHKEEAVGVTVEAGFVAAEVFMVRVVSEVFMARAGSLAFTGAVLGIFTEDISLGFMAVVTLAMIVFSFPASMDTRDGGVGVIPIHIGGTPITLTIRIARTALIGSSTG
jgi:hypothetical protein